MDDDDTKRKMAHALIGQVPAELLDDFLWVARQYAAPGLNEA